MDWQLLDEEGEPLPTERDAPPPAPRRGRWAWLLVPLLAIAVAVGALWWQQERREQQLRERFTEVVHHEARVLRAPSSEGYLTVVDPAVPASWRWAYELDSHFGSAGTVLPSVRDVALPDEEAWALVTVEYPRPDSPLYAGLEAVPERRAYRLVQGEWRRSPLPLDASERVELSSATFTLRGPRQTVAALDAEGPFLDRMEALRGRLVEAWGEENVVAARLTIEAQPGEFHRFVPLHPFAVYSGETHVTTPHIIPSPERFVADPTVPLAPERQYELAVAQGVLVRLGGARAAPRGDVPLNRLWTLWSFALELRTAEAAAWTLSEEELRSLRAWRRETLDGEWLSPFEERLPAEQAEEGRRAAALALLVEYLRLTYGDATLGEVASRLASASYLDTLGEIVAEVTGEPIETLEGAARAFALREEP